IPTDREGYHVILAIWDVADTNNAFYQVIDVNLSN
ncbi:lytic polysaccharide monooxygenase, partial [Providencia stuartii]